MIYFFLRSETDKPVKITLPGPMTVVDSTNNEFYSSEKDMAFAWARAINKEAKLLDAVGANVIQFDEPALVDIQKKLKIGVSKL